MEKGPLLAAALLGAATILGAAPALASPGPQPAPKRFHVPPPRDVTYPGTIDLHVDATDLAHRIERVHETIPVRPGPMYLLYPEWIPGYHEPSGPIDKFAGLKIEGNGQSIDWTRDPGDVYAFRVEVPKGVHTLDVRFQFLTPQKKDEGRISMTPALLSLKWNNVALYPAGYFGRDIRFRAGVTLPKGFKFATALSVAHRNGNDITFKPIDFENLVDSPMVAGKYYKRIDLAPGAKTPVHLDVFADAPRYLKITKHQIRLHRNLVQQMYDMYGSHHYNHYDFMFSLSDKLGGIGLEHHRSSEDGVKPGYFTQWKKNWAERDLLAHEFNHSWDGKYRRPAALWTPNFNVPKRDHGLWVYEGFTQYSGYVMATRAGLWTQQQARSRLAAVGGTYDRGRPGMKWRTIWDTTNDPTIAQRAPLPYRNYQMSEDYYSGGQLIWLAVDAKIRELTHDKRNLNNFARDFFGVHNGAWDINTYTFDDVVKALNGVVKYDWKDFLDKRLKGHGDLAKAFAAEGWKLVYTDKPNAAIKAYEKRDDYTDLTYSIGLSVKKDGKLRDVLWNGPAFKAGLSPGMVIQAVNGKDFSGKALKRAVTAAKDGKAPIRLLVKDFDRFRTIDIDYHGGLEYPHLERIQGRPDYLSEVLSPLQHQLAAID